MTAPAYITAVGAYLPGAPVDNDTMEERLGLVAGAPSRYRKRILRNNGIASRHYAIDPEGRQTHLNEELAAHAVRDALRDRSYALERVGMLSLGTTIPDVLMPGFASMVHGRLGGAPLETLSSSGVCASSLAALRHAVNAVRLGEHAVAVAGGSELPSPVLRGDRFAEESQLAPEREDPAGSYQYFNADFLRWMLSDGAGAVVVEGKPRPDGLSLRVDWLTLRSFANEYATCMYMGQNDPSNPRVGSTWLSQKTATAADREGMFLIRQDTKLLEQGILDIVPREFKRLALEGRIDPAHIDWFMPHVSSYFMVEKLRGWLKDSGLNPESVWTNLRTKGNTGSASIFIMLEEAVRSGMLKRGQRILIMVPESGRMTACYGHLTVVGPEDLDADGNEASLASARTTGSVTTAAAAWRPPSTPIAAHAQPLPGASTQSVLATPAPKSPTAPEPKMTTVAPYASRLPRTELDLQNALERSPLGLSFANHPGEVQRYLATELAFVWQQFCERLAQVPVVRAIESGEVTVEDYRQLLLNLRQQVIEGGRWIAHIAASMGQELFLVRSTMIRHAAEEHRDYQMLERNYVAAGGKLEEIVSAPKNVGSEAFSAYMFHNALQPNPLNMFGAMFIIEGLGQAKAGRWAEQIKEHTGLGDDAVSFLAYHGENDDDHYEKLRTILSAPFITGPVAERIVKTARTVGRLYCLQLEELGNV
ncbi:MAG: 3-oxoacyl-[acyl-carrier-protein] synthase III C-terminal domain-containing protein [Polyangiales bacterium]|nr:3-oxoacyl-ACP synthase [Sandaracinaceae bacterium]